MESLSKLVKNPPADCSAAYFWFFNDDIPVDVMISQMHAMIDKGVKALLLHPMPAMFRPQTMQTRMYPDYLTPEYFQVIKKIVEEAQRTGCHYWLYDEGGWPSGSACGQVSQADPVNFRQMRLMKQEDGTVKPCHLGAPKPGFYPNVLNRNATDKFIELTHEQYYKTVPEHFGSTVQYVFQDEACFSTPLAWCEELDDEFLKQKNYDIRNYYEQLINPPADDDPEDLIQARIDLADVRSKLFVKNFVKPIQDWCHKHNVISSGHFNGENIPTGNYSSGYGHILRAMRALDAPGIDVIWRQLYPGVCTHHFPKYASSVARQSGIQTALSESAAVYGDGFTPEELKWLIDFQAVRGINLFVISAFAMSLKDPFTYTSTRPSYDLNNPLWAYSDLWHKHIERICALLRQGKADSKTAVFHDIRSIWTGSTEMENAAAWHDATAEKLLKQHCDFDFTDDDTIQAAPFDSLDGKPALRIGDMLYTTIVVPTVNRMEDATAEKLEQFANQGGVVIDETHLQDVQPVLPIDGDVNGDLRVTKRILDEKSIYFITNESDNAIQATLHFPEQSQCVRLDDEGEFIALDSNKVTFIPRSSQLFVFGEEPTAQPPRSFTNPSSTITIEDGWTLKPVAQVTIDCNGSNLHPVKADPQPVQLGDWRPVLGEYFSGEALYAVDFQNPGATEAFLNLGDVNYACDIILNGKCISRRAWHPYSCDISEALQPGTNHLEIRMVNTRANALATPELRKRWKAQFPLCLTQYDDKEMAAEADSLPSGLFGPVTVAFN